MKKKYKGSFNIKIFLKIEDPSLVIEKEKFSYLFDNMKKNKIIVKKDSNNNKIIINKC